MRKSTLKTNKGMKTVHICKMALVMAVALIALCTSCKKDIVIYSSNAADFTVTNLRTNMTVKNEGLSLFANPLDVHRNDRLLLVYKKPQKYANSKFTITFNAFGRELTEPNVSSRQYQHTIVVESSLVDSTYSIQCKGVSDDWEDGSYDSGYVKVRVSE